MLMKKWLPIIFGSIGSFFILKSLFKLDQEKKQLIIVPLSKEDTRSIISVKEETIKNPTPNALKVVPVEPYLESGKVNINSKR